MERDSHPVSAGGGHGGGLSHPISPMAERVKITCSFCGELFEVLRPKEGGRIEVEVQCSHCARTGVVAYGDIGTRSLMTDRRSRERRSGSDRRHP